MTQGLAETRNDVPPAGPIGDGISVLPKVVEGPVTTQPKPGEGMHVVEPARSVAPPAVPDTGRLNGAPALPAAELSQLTVMGLKVAIGLAFTAILGALALCVFLVVRGITSEDVILIRVLLSCVAVFVATGFSAFGFALFLIKADGALKASIQTGAQPNTLETTAPGLAVFVCAVIIMYLALHMQLNLALPDGDAGKPASSFGQKPPEPVVQPPNPPKPPLGGDMVKPW